MPKQKMRNNGFSEELINAGTSYAETDDAEILNAKETYQKYYNEFKKETDAEKETLTSVLFNVDKFKKYNIDDSSKLKLKPIKSDNKQLLYLMANQFDKMDKSSGIYKKLYES